MEKKYGLILPSQQKKTPAVAPPVREITKPSIFDESSDSDDNNAPQLKMKPSHMSLAPSGMERRMARRMQEKALEEDPTVFQYDELYDEMETKREEAQQSKSKEVKKPKYISRLMEVAERRKLENELRIERQVQKEREAEGEEFKDKESFVTSTYRKKLEEMRKLQEQEKRDEYLEAIGDVTKQQDLDGFYRHLYEQKLGTTKEVTKPEIPTAEPEDEEVAYKPIKSGRTQQRTYRKRRASAEEDEKEIVETESKKTHLQNNIDADSDFSIDSSSDGEADDSDSEKKLKPKDEDEKVTAATIDPTKTALKLDTLKKEDKDETTKDEVGPEEAALSPTEPVKVVKEKIDIWKKRTVGEVFDAAVQRYYERKAARSA